MRTYSLFRVTSFTLAFCPAIVPFLSYHSLKFCFVSESYLVLVGLVNICCSARKELRGILEEIAAAKSWSMSDYAAFTMSGERILDLNTMLGEIGALSIQFLPKGMFVFNILPSTVRTFDTLWSF